MKNATTYELVKTSNDSIGLRISVRIDGETYNHQEVLDRVTSTADLHRYMQLCRAKLSRFVGDEFVGRSI